MYKERVRMPARSASDSCNVPDAGCTVWHMRTSLWRAIVDPCAIIYPHPNSVRWGLLPSVYLACIVGCPTMVPARVLMDVDHAGALHTDAHRAYVL